jgi:hypothetical protein
MDSLVSMVAQRTGIPEDKARTAVETVVGFIKERAPAGLSSQIDSLVGGGQGSEGSAGVSGMASKVTGMLGKKEQ